MKNDCKIVMPGSDLNYTVIVGTEWQARFGIGNPANAGDCDLFISPCDASDRPLENGQLNMRLRSGESMSWYRPPLGCPFHLVDPGCAFYLLRLPRQR